MWVMTERHLLRSTPLALAFSRPRMTDLAQSMSCDSTKVSVLLVAMPREVSSSMTS